MTCPLDDIGNDDAERWVAQMREQLKATFKMDDAQLNEAMMKAAKKLVPAGSAGAARASVFGDVSACRASKTAKIANAVHMALMAVAIVTLGILVFKKGRGRWPYYVLQSVGVLGTLLTVFTMRHILSLGAKLSWYGSGTNARALLILTAVVTVATSLLHGVKDLSRPWVVVPVLVMLAGATLAKMVFLGRALADDNKTSNLAIAMVAAVDRMLPARRLGEGRRMLGKLAE